MCACEEKERERERGRERLKISRHAALYTGVNINYTASMLHAIIIMSYECLTHKKVSVKFKPGKPLCELTAPDGESSNVTCIHIQIIRNSYFI